MTTLPALRGAIEAADTLGGRRAGSELHRDIERKVAVLRAHPHLFVTLVPEWLFDLLEKYGSWYLTDELVAWVEEDPEPRLEQLRALEERYFETKKPLDVRHGVWLHDRNKDFERMIEPVMEQTTLRGRTFLRQIGSKTRDVAFVSMRADAIVQLLSATSKGGFSCSGEERRAHIRALWDDEALQTAAESVKQLGGALRRFLRTHGSAVR